MADQWIWRDPRKRCKELIFVAMVFAILALAFTAAGFATKQWTVVSVDRVRLKQLAIDSADSAYLITLNSNYNYFPRERGLFQICFDDNTETEFLKQDDFFKSGKCLHEPAVRPKDAKASWGNDYKLRNDLVRAHIALLGIEIGFALLSLISGATTCSILDTGLLLLTAVCSVIGFFSGFAGMIIFHIYDDSETHDLNYKPFPFKWLQDTNLRQNSTLKYGFSFALAWTGTALALVATVLFWGAYFTLKGYEKQFPRTGSKGHKKHYHDHDIKPYYGIRRPRKIQKWRDVQIPANQNIYLHSDVPSSDSNRRLYYSDGRFTPSYRPYDYYDYYNIYGSSGVYPY